MEWKEGDYKISNDHSLLSTEKTWALLSKTYWASNRSREVVEKSIKHSICYGVYHRKEQIGFGRIITDHATTYYICDVVLDEKYRGRGLGKKLMECMMKYDNLSNIYGMLSTRDAHELYGQYGFVRAEKAFMHRIR